MQQPESKRAASDAKDASGQEFAAPPALSFPKGGGAIQGSGEKFSVNPATGTAGITVPIVTSPGRAGFQPDLTPSYDSGNGNGPFGMGWDLSVPSIRRKTQKELPRYHGPEEDTFILAGAEDLVGGSGASVAGG